MTSADDVGNMQVAKEPIMIPIMGSGRTQKSPEPKFTPFTRVLVQHSKKYALTPCSCPSRANAFPKSRFLSSDILGVSFDKMPIYSAHSVSFFQPPEVRSIRYSWPGA